MASLEQSAFRLSNLSATSRAVRHILHLNYGMKTTIGGDCETVVHEDCGVVWKIRS